MRRCLVVIMVLLAAGCAGQGAEDQVVGGGPTEQTQTPEESHVPQTVTFTDTTFTVEMTLHDFHYDPATIKAPGASTPTLELSNEGQTSHTFTIDALDIDEQLDAGDAMTISFDLGTETRYEYSCRFHAESNDMRGSFSLH